MTLRSRYLAIALFAAACSHGAAAPALPAPVVHTIPAALPPAAADAPAGTNRAALPSNWHLLDETNDHIAGISSERAMNELLKGKKPKRTVLVAVIDGGIDTAHADLRANLWEKRGWNFIGGKDGKDVDHDTFEATRVYASCKQRAPTGDFSAMPKPDADTCTRATTAFSKAREETSANLAGIQRAEQVYNLVEGFLKLAVKADSLTPSIVEKLVPANDTIARAKETYMDLVARGITRTEINRAKVETSNRLKYGLDPEYNSRAIVGDDTANMTERGYGNADVTGPDASHGTHVAGIIGAIRGNGLGVDGIAPAVKIMAIRAVPDGDERDKDIANAIRYAVDNGAQVINMSFGKDFSPGKSVVDEAVEYADAHGVLMVHAAGNDGENLDSAQSFPSRHVLRGPAPQNWIEVGASSWKGGANLAAEFSNYGQHDVDLFAPGVDILSTVPGGQYERDSGTSMAAPVVTGVAALVMAYYPELSSMDVKRILLNSATRHPTQLVARPGDNSTSVPFATLSATGGIVNAYNAVKMAEQVVRGSK